MGAKPLSKSGSPGFGRFRVSTIWPMHAWPRPETVRCDRVQHWGPKRAFALRSGRRSLERGMSQTPFPDIPMPVRDRCEHDQVVGTRHRLYVRDVRDLAPTLLR